MSKVKAGQRKQCRKRADAPGMKNIQKRKQKGHTLQYGERRKRPMQPCTNQTRKAMLKGGVCNKWVAKGKTGMEKNPVETGANAKDDADAVKNKE